MYVNLLNLRREKCSLFFRTQRALFTASGNKTEDKHESYKQQFYPRNSITICAAQHNACDTTV